MTIKELVHILDSQHPNAEGILKAFADGVTDGKLQSIEVKLLAYKMRLENEPDLDAGCKTAVLKSFDLALSLVNNAKAVRL